MHEPEQPEIPSVGIENAQPPKNMPESDGNVESSQENFDFPLFKEMLEDEEPFFEHFDEKFLPITI